MGYPSTPPDPPEVGNSPNCPLCGQDHTGNVAVDYKFEGDYLGEVTDILWECEICHGQYWDSEC